MPGSVCPQCGALLQGDRPRFCDQCGHNLLDPAPKTDDVPQPAVSAAPETERAGDALQESSADTQASAGLGGKPNEPDAKAPPPTAITEQRTKTVVSSEPGRKDHPDKRKESTSRGLALSINMNQFYMAGFSGVLDLKLENLSQTGFDLLEVEVAGNLLNRAECWACALDACDHVHKRHPAQPPDPGVKMVTFRVNAQQGDSVYSYWAEGDLLVFENTQNLHEVKLQADNMVNVSAGTGKQMGNSVNNNINIMVDQGKIRNVNDLMLEYRKLPPDFQIVPLRFDPRQSKELTQALRHKLEATGAKRLVEPARGSPTDSASLCIKAKDKTTNILLLAKPCVTLGKNRRNDIVTRLAPRSAQNDALSNQMSRDHCRIELRQGGLIVLDEGSVNGTTLDGQKVDAGGRLIQDQTKDLVLGEVLSLSVRYMGGHLPQPCGGYNDAMGDAPGEMWELADPAGPAALLLERAGNLGADDENGCESYCLVYRVAVIGCGEDCAIRICDRGLEPLQAALVHWGGRFFLENLAPAAEVKVNDRKLAGRELIPLSFGDRIQIARLDMQFVQRCQLFVDG
ncbi:MAG: FHA domain-containing protein [Planctomycetes bacterium]|nr:FHA domain-containing protein [Planctomycetota bacterium]